MKDLRVAGSFLTRVPMHVEGTAEVARATPWFPVVGLGIGAAGAAVLALAAWLLPSGPAAALALVTTALITGAFHHDGLADIADAFGGGWDVEQRLVILKDSRHGTYGVVSLVLAGLVQWSALASVPAAWGVAAVVAAHVLGRAAILGVLLAGRRSPARPRHRLRGRSRPTRRRARARSRRRSRRPRPRCLGAGRRQLGGARRDGRPRARPPQDRRLHRRRSGGDRADR